MTSYQPNGRQEQIHLPEPSLHPFAAAMGLLLGLMGLILSWWIVGLGAVVLLIAVVGWIQTARVEYDALPRK